MANCMAEDNTAYRRDETVGGTGSPLKRNVAANFIGRVWTALVQLAFIPLYIKFLGMEAYGLVGFFTTLQIVFFLLDMGLSTALNREVARRSVQEDSAQKTRDMVRTLEAVYWAIALLIGCLIVGLSPLIARWANAEKLSPETLRNAIAAMGLAIALQFPFALYQGGLLGLQRQVLVNCILVISATVRAVGAVLLLWLVAPTVQVFFAWQIAVSAAQTLVGAAALWRSVPKGARARFQKNLLASVWRFGAGMAGITALAVLLTQLDKVIVSKLLSLETFGYYTLAGQVATCMSTIASPVFTAMFPRFSQLVMLEDEQALSALYHRACQLVSVLVLPVAAVLVVFSREVLLLWTHNEMVAEKAHLLVSLLVGGSALNGLMSMPYALQLAHGWTRLALLMNLFSVIVLVPATYFLAVRFLAPGAASVCVILNATYVLIGVQLMHRRLLKKEAWRWYSRDVGLPMMAALACAGLGRWLLPAPASRLGTLGLVAGLTAASLAASALAAPAVREGLLICIKKARERYAG